MSTDLTLVQMEELYRQLEAVPRPPRLLIILSRWVRFPPERRDAIAYVLRREALEALGPAIRRLFYGGAEEVWYMHPMTYERYAEYLPAVAMVCGPTCDNVPYHKSQEPREEL